MEITMKKIAMNPNICHGKAHIEGTRIPVHIILDLLAVNESHENILKEYPQLDKEDILIIDRNKTRIRKENI